MQIRIANDQCIRLRSCILGIGTPVQPTLSSCTVLIGWQTEKLEINTSGAKDPASNKMRDVLGTVDSDRWFRQRCIQLLSLGGTVQ
jgi:hypothetical protein